MVESNMLIMKDVDYNLAHRQMKQRKTYKLYSNEFKRTKG